MSDIILIIDRLFKNYGDKIALNNVSINIKKGCIYGLIGQNGAGKTTLIRILNKIIEAEKGSILFNDKILESKDVQKIGYLPEERGLYKNMSIEDQALYFGQLKGMSKTTAKEQLSYWLEKFDILDWKKKKIENLSKGMAQKIQFIITVLHEPELIILDEPFSGLDPINADIIANEIKELSKKGKTIIFSSHRMESVTDMCDQLALIHKGEILLKGSLSAIQNKYASEIYEVTIKNLLKDALIDLKNNAKLEIIKIKLIGDLTQLEIVTTTLSNNELLNKISVLGNVQLFKRHMPSLQEIFIKTIGNA